ncbi:MAG: protein kinase [Kofleriaceae bacterium]
MKPPTREDLELYVIGEYDGDIAALEQYLATDEAARAIVAEEAELELALRAAGAAGTFCAACDDVVRADQCESCGACVRAGGYTIERVLVQHSHGRMYVARDADRTKVALKELAFVHAPDAEARAAFEREARMLRALDHPAIPRFVASFEEGRGVHTRYYLAQDLVDGQSLAARLGEHFYAEAEIIELARHVLRVLVYLQGLSPMVVHRDIKPSNLVQRADGSIAVVDFGAAHVQGATIGSTSIGTFGYMPVEQMVGLVDATTDTYALGASLLHLLTRREPWKLLQSPAWDAVNVSPKLRAYLQKLVAAEPRDRFASAALALDTLDHLETTKMTPSPAVRWVPRFMIAAAACLALAGVGAAGYAIGFRHSPEPTVSRAWPAPAWPRSIPAPAPVLAPHARLAAGPAVDLDFKNIGAHDVFRVLAKKCGVGVVIPDSIDFKLTFQAGKIPCGAVFEDILEAHGLWYVYEPDAELVRIASRKDLDADDEAALERSKLHASLHRSDDVFPSSKTVDLDMKGAPMRDMLVSLASLNGYDALVPESIGGAVTVVAKAPWNRVFPALLASHGLWYRLHGKVIRIAPRHELDAEDEAELARRRY